MRGPPTSAWAIPSRCCMPFDIDSTRRAGHVGEADQLEQPPALAAPPSDPARPWWTRSSSSAVIQPGNRKSSAR